mgnify:CR=1 FL=1
MIYTASSAADQTACWITGIVIAALIFLFVKFAAKGSKPLEKIMLASGCVIVLLTTLIVKVPAPDSFNPETGFSEKERRKDRRILIRIFSAIGLTALWFIPIRNTEWFEALIEKHIWVTPAMLAVFLLAGWILTGQLTRWYTKERRTDKHTGRKKRSSQRNRTPYKVNSNMKRAVIIGATSGIGREVAKQLLLQGWHLGIAGRRLPSLEALQSSAPDRVEVAALDVTQPDAAPKLSNLIRRVGGMDLFLLSSGIGYQNIGLNPDIELETTRTNVEGFTRMVDTAFNYFREHGGGQLAVISSVAGTKGLGVAPAYSATKRFQNTYIDALEQLACMQKLNICFTDIRPGFVSTDLLNDGKRYPLLMQPEKVARQIVRALHHRKRVAVIDWRYAVIVFFWRMIPRWIWKRLPIRTGKTM